MKFSSSVGDRWSNIQVPICSMGLWVLKNYICVLCTNHGKTMIIMSQTFNEKWFLKIIFDIRHHDLSFLRKYINFAI